MWTVEYQAVKGGPWIFAGIWAEDAHRAWEAFSILAGVTGLDYYAAQAFGPPASLSALAASGHTV